jgi:lysozyme
MRLDEKGYAALHLREGLKLKPYLDTKGVPTIAMGNTYYLDGRKVTMKDRTLTLIEAKLLAKVTADDFASKVDRAITSIVNQNQFNACVSLSYNIGIYGFLGSTALKLIDKNPNDLAIGKAFMMWTKDKELIGRRKSEVKQYFT